MSFCELKILIRMRANSSNIGHSGDILLPVSQHYQSDVTVMSHGELTVCSVVCNATTFSSKK